jgi:transcriptional regulator with XRE-family HTH domain
VYDFDYSEFSGMKNEEMLLNLADRIRKIRKEKGITQDQVLFDTGIHVARIEQGKRDASYTTLCRLADYLNVSLADFR